LGRARGPTQPVPAPLRPSRARHGPSARGARPGRRRPPPPGEARHPCPRPYKSGAEPARDPCRPSRLALRRRLSLRRRLALSEPTAAAAPIRRREVPPEETAATSKFARSSWASPTPSCCVGSTRAPPSHWGPAAPVLHRRRRLHQKFDPVPSSPTAVSTPSCSSRSALSIMCLTGTLGGLGRRRRRTPDRRHTRSPLRPCPRKEKVLFADDPL
jgi:hypothetical protein